MPDPMHPLIAAAGGTGELPAWARCRPERRAHAERVAALMDGWGRELGLDASERLRWRAAGRLHDALKDAPAGELARLAGPGWPEALLHAPACANRLRQDGVRDEELLTAVAYHSTGHPAFAELGEFLYMADFLDPEREFLPELRAGLRARLPAARRDVLATILAHRIGALLERGRPVLPASIELWNREVEA